MHNTLIRCSKAIKDESKLDTLSQINKNQPTNQPFLTNFAFGLWHFEISWY